MSRYEIFYQGKVTSSKQADCRFAVGEPDGPRSSIWRLWATPKGDVYLTARSLGGTMKASLHRSGNWQFGFTSEFETKGRSQGNWPLDSRHIERWVRPPEIGGGITLAFRVVIPASELREWPLETSKEVQWLPAPDSGNAGVIELAFTEEALPLSKGWPGKNRVRTSPFGLIGLATGEFAWLLYRQEAMTDEYREKLEEYRARVLGQVPGPILKGKRIALHGLNHEDGCRFFIDLAADHSAERPSERED